MSETLDQVARQLESSLSPLTSVSNHESDDEPSISVSSASGSDNRGRERKIRHSHSASMSISISGSSNNKRDGGENQGVQIQELAAKIKKYQDEITRRLNESLRNLFEVDKNNGAQLIKQIMLFCNEAMSNAFLKAKNGVFLKKLQSPEGSVRSPDTFESLMQSFSQPQDVKEAAEIRIQLFNKMLGLEKIEPLQLFENILQKQDGFEFLLEITQKELEYHFGRLYDPKASLRTTRVLIELWKIFNGQVATEVLNATDFLRRHPEAYDCAGDCASGEDIDKVEAFLAHVVNNTYESFNVVKNAICRVIAQKNIDIDGVPKVAVVVERIQDVPPYFLQYLKEIMKDKTANDPFRQYTDTVGKLASEFQKPLRRRSFSGRSLSPPTMQRRPSDPLISPVRRVTTDFMLRDESDNQANVQAGFALANNYSSFAISPPATVHSELDPEDAWVVVVSEPDEMGSAQEVRKCFHPNSMLALLRRGPFVRLNTGLAMHYAFNQFFSVYPNIRPLISPYFIFGDVLGGIVGVIIGRKAILRPNEEPTTIYRLLNASSEGLLVFVFILGGTIKIFLLENPSVTNISDERFYTQFVTAPFLLSLGYTAWNSIENKRKESWSLQNRLGYYSVIGIDFLLNFLLFGSIFQISELNFFNIPSWIAYVLVPSALSIATTALKTFTRYGESIRSVLSYLGLGNFLYLLSEEYSQSEFNSVSDYARAIFYGVAGTYSLVFMYKQSRMFLLVFKEGELITRLVSTREIFDRDALEEDSLELPPAARSLMQYTEPLISSRLSDDLGPIQPAFPHSHAAALPSASAVRIPSTATGDLNERLQDLNVSLDGERSRVVDTSRNVAPLAWDYASRQTSLDDAQEVARPVRTSSRRCFSSSYCTML